MKKGPAEWCPSVLWKRTVTFLYFLHSGDPCFLVWQTATAHRPAILHCSGVLYTEKPGPAARHRPRSPTRSRTQGAAAGRRSSTLQNQAHTRRRCCQSPGIAKADLRHKSHLQGRAHSLCGVWNCQRLRRRRTYVEAVRPCKSPSQSPAAERSRPPSNTQAFSASTASRTRTPAFRLHGSQPDTHQRLRHS